jgi:hypothetical protein
MTITYGFISILAIFSLSCTSPLLRIHLSKNESYIGAADSKVVNFVQVNNIVVLSQKNDWHNLRPVMQGYLETSLFQIVDRYMSATANSGNTADDWWIQRGIVYLSGNSPWRCKLRREKVEKGVITYSIRYRLHTSKESFGDEETTVLKVAVVDAQVKIIDILFQGHPAEKGVTATRYVSIREWIKYANQAGYLKSES